MCVVVYTAFIISIKPYFSPFFFFYEHLQLKASMQVRIKSNDSNESTLFPLRRWLTAGLEH